MSYLVSYVVVRVQRGILQWSCHLERSCLLVQFIQVCICAYPKLKCIDIPVEIKLKCRITYYTIINLLFFFKIFCYVCLWFSSRNCIQFHDTVKNWWDINITKINILSYVYAHCCVFSCLISLYLYAEYSNGKLWFFFSNFSILY